MARSRPSLRIGTLRWRKGRLRGRGRWGSTGRVTRMRSRPRRGSGRGGGNGPAREDAWPHSMSGRISDLDDVHVGSPSASARAARELANGSAERAEYSCSYRSSPHSLTREFHNKTSIFHLQLPSIPLNLRPPRPQLPLRDARAPSLPRRQAGDIRRGHRLRFAHLSTFSLFNFDPLYACFVSK